MIEELGSLCLASSARETGRTAYTAMFELAKWRVRGVGIRRLAFIMAHL